MTRFRSDPLNATLPLIRVIGPFVLIAAASCVYLSSKEPSGVGALLLLAAIIVGAVLLICALVALAVSTSFVEIGEDGIRKAIFGQEGKIRRWDTITAIYKITYFDKQLAKNQFEFVVTTNSDRPLFIGNLIKSKLSLVSTLNGFIEKHKTPSFVLDRSIKGGRAQFIAALSSRPSNIGLPIAGESVTAVSGF